MNVFNKIRDLFGVKSDVDTSELAQLRTLRIEQGQLNEQLTKAQREFDQLDLELSLQVQACDQLLEKGESVSEATTNRGYLKDRQLRLTESFLNERSTLVSQHRELGRRAEELEGDIIAKAVEVTAELNEEDQELVKAAIVDWQQTGKVGDEMIVSQVEAITTVLEEVVVKGGEGSRGGKVIGHTRSGKAIYSKFAHEGHKDFSTEDHDDAKDLQRKRAAGHSDAVRSSNIWQEAAKHSNAANNNRRNAAQKEKEARPGYAEKSKRLKELHAEMESIPKYGEMGLPSKGKDTERWTKLHAEYKQLHEELNKAEEEQPITLAQVELLEKASPEQKKKVRKVMDEWKSGKLKSSSGDKVANQKQAIAIALSEAGLSKSDDDEDDDLQKAGKGEGSRGGHIIGHDRHGRPVYGKYNPSEQRLTSFGDMLIDVGEKHHQTYGHLQKAQGEVAVSSGNAGAVVYDSPVAGHYANALVRMNVKSPDGNSMVEKILFLKRATNKTIAPGKYCLPGGHIEEGETISQAALRELKEEANLTSSYSYVLGKAKCDDGKWCFYCEVTPDNPAALALLDGESINAHWMTRDEWMKADLFFDLKDHLVALTTSEQSIGSIRDIMKPEKAPKNFKKGEDVQELELFTEPEQLVDVNELSKAGGEGSRGGHIIGHTRSGKPVYINFSHVGHKDFSDDDHMDASTIHKKLISHQKTAQDVNVHALAGLDHIDATSAMKKFKENLGKSIFKHQVGTKVKVKIARPMNQNKFDEHHIIVDSHEIGENGKPMYGGKTEKGKHRWFQDEHVIQ